MKGSVSEPALSAEIVLHDVGYTLPQIDPFFKEINGKIQLTSSHLKIKNISGKLDSRKANPICQIYSWNYTKYLTIS